MIKVTALNWTHIVFTMSSALYTFVVSLIRKTCIISTSLLLPAWNRICFLLSIQTFTYYSVINVSKSFSVKSFFFSSKPQLQAAEKLTEYLIALGSSSMSESFLIRHILSQISALADQLWQAFQVNTPTASPHILLHSHHLFPLLLLYVSFSSLSLCEGTANLKRYELLTVRINGSFAFEPYCHHESLSLTLIGFVCFSVCFSPTGSLSLCHTLFYFTFLLLASHPLCKASGTNGLPYRLVATATPVPT